MRTLSVSLGQYNALNFFALQRNVFSEINKVLVNDIFAEFDGGSEIKNIITDRLNPSELQVDHIST